jgi:hypothetical protein
VELESFTDQLLLDAVSKRYKANVMYTFVGDILLAVNPYQSLGLYFKKFKERYGARVSFCEWVKKCLKWRLHCSPRPCHVCNRLEADIYV